VRAEARAIAIRTPFRIGPTSVYLIRGAAAVLVDTGPNVPEAIADLERGLAAAALQLEDIDLVILTHQHTDHVGLAGVVAERSGCAVAAPELLAPFFADYVGSIARESAYQRAVCLLHGMPAELADGIADRLTSNMSLVAPLEITRPLRDEEVIDVGGLALQALARPGHSPSDTIYVDHDHRRAFVGDHLIAHLSSNPIVHRPLTRAADPASRPSSLSDYLESLTATAELDLDVLYPGHGRPITDHRALIAERLEFHRERAGKVCALLGDRPAAAFALAEGLFGPVAREQPYLTLSETLGALDLLVAEGRAELVSTGAAIRYRRSALAGSPT
jgi:glyoxylase-like metal-dependent hydrolase (beta-lactamase superfamily II)